eukprot:351937-Chlamydomonas_euryale.AAC.8
MSFMSFAVLTLTVSLSVLIGDGSGWELPQVRRIRVSRRGGRGADCDGGEGGCYFVMGSGANSQQGVQGCSFAMRGAGVLWRGALIRNKGC